MKVVFVVGPTGSGKSKLSLDLATEFEGSIINADSIQFYKHFDIGSAKPTVTEMKLRPHFLFDLIEPLEEFSAADFRRSALKTLNDLKSQNCPLALIVGGSGFYLRALLFGMNEWPKTPDDVRKSVEQEIHTSGISKLYKELCARDPLYGASLHPNDTYRITRAIEILRAQDKTITELQSQKKKSDFPFEYKILGIQVDRTILRERIQKRTETMLQSGWMDEVKIALQKGWEKSPVLRSVGYLEICEHLKGNITLEEMSSRIVISTMQLAKKQMTWFRNQMNVEWLEADEGLKEAHKLVRALLNS
jgi:tRNA dimethylallyltransferase